MNVMDVARSRGRHQPGPSGAQTAVVVTVTPTTAGRTIRVERLSGRSWKVVAKATTDRAWSSWVSVATYAGGSPVTYRATAAGLPGPA